MSTSVREKLKNRALLCSRMGRYEEMLNHVKGLAQKSTPAKPLTEEERTLLSIAFKNCVGVRRTGWRNVCKIERMERSDNFKRKADLAREFKKTIENEMIVICKDLLNLLDKKLLVKNMEDETAVFFYKMKGDYSRYIAEVSTDNSNVADSHVNMADAAYKEAEIRAGQGLSPTHPLRIGFALNYSVFLHEMKQDSEAGFQIAKKHYDEALEELNSVDVVDEERYGECRNLLTLLHENLKLWASSPR